MHRADTSTIDRPGLTPPLRVLLGFAGFVILLAGLSYAAPLVGPLAIAATIVIVCAPVRQPLERWGWPSWLATLAVILVCWAVLIALAAMLAYALAEFTNMVIKHYDSLHDTVVNAVALLHEWGFDKQVAEAASSILTPSAIIGFVSELGTGTLSLLTMLFFIFAYVIFMAADGGRFMRAEQVHGPPLRPVINRTKAFNKSVRKYFVVNTVIGLVCAVVDGLALWWLGVPAPVVWAILSFVTAYIPNVGFVIGLLPPMLLALAVNGVGTMVWVIVIYCVVNVALSVLLQPKIVADVVSLSLTLSFFSVLFWTFILGPIGAILSIPLTLLVREVVFGIDPSTRWLRWLSGDDEAVPPRGEDLAAVASDVRARPEA